MRYGTEVIFWEHIDWTGATQNLATSGDVAFGGNSSTGFMYLKYDEVGTETVFSIIDTGVMTIDTYGTTALQLPQPISVTGDIAEAPARGCMTASPGAA